MTTTPDTPTTSDVEERLRAALSARAELVRPEGLQPLAPVVGLRPRWQSPWVLLATAAAVLLILGTVLQGIGRDPRSDDVAPKPDEPAIVFPPDVGRDWKADDLSSPARLDLDGDGTREKVVFLSEDNGTFDGRVRLQATVSGTGEEVYGVVELGSTIGISPLEPIDADRDGDQELVLLRELDPDVVGGSYAPVVLDLRDGLLVEAVPEDAELLRRGTLPVPGSETEFYDLARIHDFWIEDGELFSGRSVNSFARGNMTLVRPERIVLESWVWRLDESGVLRAEDAGCRLDTYQGRTSCGSRTEDDPLEVGEPATEHWGVGEGGDITRGYRFRVAVEPGNPPSVVVTGGDGRSIRHEVDVADPRVATVQPFGAMYDGASVALTSGSDPDVLTVLGQDDGRLVEIRAIGELPFGNGTLEDGRIHRSWMTREGELVTAVSTAEHDQWDIYAWQLVRDNSMTALPRGRACIADIQDPAGGC